MPLTREMAVEVGVKAREALSGVYGPRLKGVYLFGSAARGEATADSDIDLAIVLDRLGDPCEEIERTSRIGSTLSLDTDVLVSFLFIPESDLATGRHAVHRAIRREGVPV